MKKKALIQWEASGAPFPLAMSSGEPLPHFTTSGEPDWIDGSTWTWTAKYGKKVHDPWDDERKELEQPGPRVVKL